jgi:predicted RNA-binding protein with RPS1 domain
LTEEYALKILAAHRKKKIKKSIQDSTEKKKKKKERKKEKKRCLSLAQTRNKNSSVTDMCTVHFAQFI